MSETTEVQGEHRDLTNRELRGITARLLWMVIVSAVTVVSGVLKVYYDQREADKATNARCDALQLQVDFLRGQQNDIKLRLNDHDAQFIRLDDRFFYNKKHPANE